MIQDPTNDPIVERKVGNKLLQMRASHKLPSYYDAFPFFYDRALPRIAEKIGKIDGSLNLIDIGANIGDTVSLITDKVDGSFLCVEGDEQFLPFLKKNLEGLKKSKIVIEESFCGESPDQSESLKIRHENGTARLEIDREADGHGGVKLKSLDDIIDEHPYFKKTNLLKTDTDGFDANILRSGRKFLKGTKPVIHFEFDPELYSVNGEDPSAIFDFLYKNGYREALVYDNFGIPIKVIDMADEKEVRGLLAMIDKKKIYYYDILTVHRSKEERYRSLFDSELLSSVSLLDALLNLTKTHLDSAEASLGSTKLQLDSAVIELASAKADLISKANELNEIYYSRGWRFVMYAREILNHLIPKEGARRKTVAFFYGISKKSVKKMLGIKGKIATLFSRGGHHAAISRPKKERKINRQSKKIVFVGHSFHKKTRSTAFMIDYLRQSFEVKEILDESWIGKTRPDLSFVDETYLAVIFWQLVPPENVIQSIKNDNIIYFPMFDDSGGLDLGFWNDYRGLKVVNFSKTLHDKLVNWGFESIYVQYFPKPDKFTPGNKNEVFFWQRLSHLNINIVAKLFGNGDFKIHLHKAVDPGQGFVQPSRVLEKKFKITYSDWFEDKAEMLNLIKQKGIYVAPREFEGIGMSFLEAMAIGKAVIAVNNPTMNEYIEDGKNGYLFDLRHPKGIDLSDIEQVQKSTYEFMQKGYAQWEKDKASIVEFIRQS
jgi:FkbM family methyltransferase